MALISYRSLFWWTNAQPCSRMEYDFSETPPVSLLQCVDHM